MPINLQLEDGSAFPHPEYAGELEYALRYHPESLTKGQLLTVASIVAAYRALATEPRFERKPRMIRRALRATRPTPGGEHV